MKRLFLTGAQGFVGQWVQRMAAPIEESHGYRLAIPPRGFELLDAAHLDAQLAEHRPDAILHLAGQSNVPESFKDPAGTFRTNVLGTLQLLEAIKRSGLSPRMVMPSSGEVYGLVPDEQMPIGEDRLPRPRNPYAVSKLAAEALCYQWSQTEGLAVMVARAFNHIGSGQAPTFVLPSFAQQIAAIKAGTRAPVIEVGDIDVRRDFTHVGDVIEAYLVLLGNGVAGEVYNVASGEDHAVRELLERMLRLAGVDAQVRPDPARLRRAEQRVMKGRIDKIKGLGWSPRRSIDEALADVLNEWERKTTNG